MEVLLEISEIYRTVSQPASSKTFQDDELLNYKKLKTFKLNVFKFKNNFCYIAKNISILVFTDVEVLIWQSLALS